MPIERTTAHEAHALRGADPGVVLLDVRTPDEVAQGHPPGALNVPVVFPGMAPNPEFLRAVEQLAPDKARPVLLICAGGGRSLRACEPLAEAGWTRPVNVEGGFQGAWAPGGLPVAQEPEGRWDAVRARLTTP